MLARVWLVLALLSSAPAAGGDCDDAATQMALDQCAGAELQREDDALNATYRQIVARLVGDADTDRLLRAAQRAWLDFRDRECAFATAAAVGGSIHPTLVANCRTELTRQRTERLAVYLHCAEGDLACPVPAP